MRPVANDAHSPYHHDHQCCTLSFPQPDTLYTPSVPNLIFPYYHPVMEAAPILEPIPYNRVARDVC